MAGYINQAICRSSIKIFNVLFASSAAWYHLANYQLFHSKKVILD